MATPNGAQPRGGNGRWVRTEAGRQRDALALEMRSRGRTYREIAEHLGYPDEGNAHRGVETALGEVHQPTIDKLRAEMAARLDELQRDAMGVLEAKHIKLHEGAPVYLDGTLVEDDAPVLRAAETILKIEARRSALFGLDAPNRTEMNVQVVDFTIAGVPPEEV